MCGPADKEALVAGAYSPTCWAPAPALLMRTHNPGAAQIMGATPCFSPGKPPVKNSLQLSLRVYHMLDRVYCVVGRLEIVEQSCAEQMIYTSALHLMPLCSTSALQTASNLV